jgi:Zn-dependent membrane protease YugP
MSFFNPLYLLLIVPALLGLYAQRRVRAIYEQYGASPNGLGVSGLEAAKRLLSHHGLTQVDIERTPGHLTDHYDPRAKVLRLSDGVAHGQSVTALGIVAHEVGHAVQDAEGYRLMRARTFLAHRVGQMTQWSSFIFIGGMLFGVPILMGLGGVLLAGLTLFALVTLPVERNASERALVSLQQTGLTETEETEGARRVLRAAALTYLAGLGQRLGTFLFFVVVIAAALGSR